jgi:hypothetical protein
MIVAATALFVALGAGAYAAIGIPLPKNSVGGNAIKAQGVKTRNYSKASILGRFIANNQVKTPAIHDAAVNSQKVSLIKSSSVSSANSTTSNSPTDLGGPSVEVTVPDGGVVELFAQADLQVSGGTTPTAKVDLVEPTLLPTPTTILSSGSNTAQTNYTAPGTPNGVNSATRAGWITLAPPAGTYTFSLRYETSGGSTATFTNRTLLARVTQ